MRFRPSSCASWCARRPIVLSSFSALLSFPCLGASVSLWLDPLRKPDPGHGSLRKRLLRAGDSLGEILPAAIEFFARVALLEPVVLLHDRLVPVVAVGMRAEERGERQLRVLISFVQFEKQRRHFPRVVSGAVRPRGAVAVGGGFVFRTKRPSQKPH